MSVWLHTIRVSDSESVILCVMTMESMLATAIVFA